ncbi:type VII secretion integral membrane protein EccD [Nakamurella sp. UYEF19]|uniref:type VII secretion integral membrane protein EccD n=1 Tax=Nakamurella sp. UYEF19 TaxID=1756392 RepID=UPI003398559A
MGTRFTRVTVIGDGRQIDISLPADAPLAEQLPTVLRLLSVPSTPVPVRWRLAAPEFGPLEPSRSLDDAGVLDGAQLYLTEAASAPPPPFVDDVESAVAEMVVASAPGWTGDTRRSAIAMLLAIVLFAALLVGLTSRGAVDWLAPALVIVGALVAGGVIRQRGGWVCSLVAVPAAVLLVLGLVAVSPSLLGLDPTEDVLGAPADRSALQIFAEATGAAGWNGFPLLLVAAGALALALAGIVRRHPGVTIGGSVAVVLSLLALLCTRAGMPADRTAGLAVVVAVLLAGLAGQVALGGAGLVDLMVADERGEPVPRLAVAAAVRRGLGLTGGMVWAAVSTATAACLVLILRSPDSGTPSGWIAPAVGALGGLIFGLRSRMFTRASHVGPMLAVVVVAVVAVAVRLPVWLELDADSRPVITLLVLVLAGLLGAGSGLRSLREVAGARLQRTLERLELLAMLALVPGIVLLFRVIPMVQRWWS